MPIYLQIAIVMLADVMFDLALLYLLFGLTWKRTTKPEKQNDAD